MEITQTPPDPPGPLRCLAVGVLGGAALLALGWLCLASTVPVLSRMRGGATTTSDPSAPVVVLAGLAGTIACLYLSGVVARTAWAAARGGRVRSDGFVRRITLAACGTALAVSALAPAHAADLSDLDGLPLPERPTSSAAPLVDSPTPEASARATTEPDVSATATPAPQVATPSARATARATTTPSERPSTQPSARAQATTRPSAPAPATPSAPAPATPSAPAPATPSAPAPAEANHLVGHTDEAGRTDEPGDTHVVAPGDTLWALAADLVAADPSDTPVSQASIARLVHEIHATNRSVIGTDPDLLLPGQELSLPRHRTTPEEER